MRRLVSRMDLCRWRVLCSRDCTFGVFSFDQEIGLVVGCVCVSMSLRYWCVWSFVLFIVLNGFHSVSLWYWSGCWLRVCISVSWGDWCGRRLRVHVSVSWKDRCGWHCGGSREMVHVEFQFQ